MKETPKEEKGILDIKQTIKVLNKLSNSLNVLLVKSNKTYLLPDVEIEEIIKQWNKYKNDFAKIDEFCELYLTKKMEVEGNNFNYSNMQVYVTGIRNLLNDYSKIE